MKEQDNKQETAKWPQQALREVCTIQRLSPVSIGSKTRAVRPAPGNILLVQAEDQFRAIVCDGSDLTIDEPCVLVKTNDKVLPEFLAMVMERKSFLKLTEQMCAGGFYGHKKVLLANDIRGVLERINVGLPPMEEQAQIVRNCEKYVTHIQQMASNFRRLANTMDDLHKAMVGQMLQRKVDNNEIRDILGRLSGMMGGQSRTSKERDGEPAVAASGRPAPGP